MRVVSSLQLTEDSTSQAIGPRETQMLNIETQEEINATQNHVNLGADPVLVKISEETLIQRSYATS